MQLLLRRFLKSPFRVKILLLESFVLAAIIRISLWIVPFKIFKKGFDKIVREEDSKLAQTDWKRVNEIVSAVTHASRLIPEATCLTQALATILLIKLSGHHSELKIGVVKDEKAEFKAHAWVEINKRIIIGRLPSHEKFTVLDSLAG